MMETVNMARIWRRAIWEKFEESISSNMEVDEHQRSIFVIEAKRLVNSELAVERQ
jgi:hypothetical protein